MRFSHEEMFTNTLGDEVQMAELANHAQAYRCCRGRFAFEAILGMLIGRLRYRKW